MKSSFRFDNHCLLRRVDNSSQTSPWFRITAGILKKERSTSLLPMLLQRRRDSNSPSRSNSLILVQKARTMGFADGLFVWLVLGIATMAAHPVGDVTGLCELQIVSRLAPCLFFHSQAYFH